MMRRFWLAFLLILVVSPAWAGRQFESGFEEGSLTTDFWNGVGSGATIVTTHPHYGSHLRTASNSPGVRRSLASDRTSGTVWVSFYWEPATLPTSGTNTRIMTVQSGGGTANWTLSHVRADNTLSLANTPGGTSIGTTATVSVGTIYRIEVRHLLSDTVGELELNLYVGDETSPVDTKSLVSQDTLGSNVGQFFFPIDTPQANGQVWHYDDITINTCSGTSQGACTGFQEWSPGPHKITLVKPASNATVMWTKTGANCSGTTNADCVDDLPGTIDNASGYNATTTATDFDDFNPTGLPAGVPSDADIKVVDVWAKFGGASNTGTNQARLYLYDEVSALTLGPLTASSSGCDVVSTFAQMRTDEHLVFNPGARTKANLDSFKYGYEASVLDATGACWATALWINIEWIETSAPPAGGAPGRMLLGVGQ